MRLTGRQTAVLEAAARGLCIKRTAKALGLHETTVRNHRAAARRKLGAITTTDAVARALRTGLL